MPSTPDIYVPCEDCERVADLVRWFLRTVTWIEPEDAFHGAVNAVVRQIQFGEWRHWNTWRQETAVAVAQRVAYSILWGGVLTSAHH